MSSELGTIAERRSFVDRNHTCVIGYNRTGGPPSMSIVHYVMDGDDIVFLTMKARQKTRAVNRLGELSVCVLDGPQGGLGWPPEYLVVDGKAAVVDDMDYVVSQAMRIAPIMLGSELPEEARPGVREMMEREERVAIRVSPLSTFHSPSVHPEAGDSSDDMVHGLGSRLPWKEG